MACLFLGKEKAEEEHRKFDKKLHCFLLVSYYITWSQFFELLSKSEDCFLSLIDSRYCRSSLASAALNPHLCPHFAPLHREDLEISVWAQKLMSWKDSLLSCHILPLKCFWEFSACVVFHSSQDHYISL